MSKILSLTVSVLSFLSAVSQTWAAPSRLFRDDLVNSTHPFAEYGLAGDKRADKVPLRILSLGASIMSGVGSSTGNGCVESVKAHFTLFTNSLVFASLLEMH